MKSGYEQISVAEVGEKLAGRSPVVIVDVRERWEYEHRHIPQALLMPVGEFAGWCRAELSPSQEIILVCEHGVRSESAARHLASLGYEHVATMTGGMSVYDGVVEGAM